MAEAVRTPEDILGWKTPFPTNKPWKDFRNVVKKECLGPFEGETGWQYKMKKMEKLCTWARDQHGLELRGNDIVTGSKSGTYGTRRYIIDNKSKDNKSKSKLLQIEFATDGNWYVCAVNKINMGYAKDAAKERAKEAAGGGAKKEGEVKRDASAATSVSPSPEVKKAKLSSDDAIGGTNLFANAKLQEEKSRLIEQLGAEKEDWDGGPDKEKFEAYVVGNLVYSDHVRRRNGRNGRSEGIQGHTMRIYDNFLVKLAEQPEERTKEQVALDQWFKEFYLHNTKMRSEWKVRTDCHTFLRSSTTNPFKPGKCVQGLALRQSFSRRYLWSRR